MHACIHALYTHACTHIAHNADGDTYIHNLHAYTTTFTCRYTHAYTHIAHHAYRNLSK